MLCLHCVKNLNTFCKVGKCGKIDSQSANHIHCGFFKISTFILFFRRETRKHHCLKFMQSIFCGQSRTIKGVFWNLNTIKSTMTSFEKKRKSIYDRKFTTLQRQIRGFAHWPSVEYITAFFVSQIFQTSKGYRQD